MIFFSYSKLDFFVDITRSKREKFNSLFFYYLQITDDSLLDVALSRKTSL